MKSWKVSIRKHQGMEPIPEDVLFQHILPWLPTKSLVRFRCVCKSWYSFISDPSFLRRCRAINPPKHHFLFVSHDPEAKLMANSEPHVFSAPFNHVDQTPPHANLLLTIPGIKFPGTRVQCVNGMLCFHPETHITLFSPESAFAIIANPTTREVVTLPIDESICTEWFKVSTQFGYDPLNDQFKILRVIRVADLSVHYKVFTLGAADSSWRVITPSIPSHPKHIMDSCLFHYSKRGIYLHGAIHWGYDKGEILVFDVTTENFRVMNITYWEDHGAKSEKLVEIRGCLSLVRDHESYMKLWILKDYEAEVWEEKYIILSSEIVQKKRVVSPLCSVPTGEILLVQSIFLSRPVNGTYYDMDTMSFTSALVMHMDHPLWPHAKSGELDIFFSEENNRFLK